MNLQYNTQTDERWANDIMTTKDGCWIDNIGRWGCVVTCLANIMQEITGEEMTPAQLNKLIVKNNGYWYLSGKTKEEKNASYIDWNIVERLLKIKHEDVSVIHYDSCSGHWIAQVSLFGSPHYINVLKKLENDNFVCFDAYDGETKIYKSNEIHKLIRIEG